LRVNFAFDELPGECAKPVRLLGGKTVLKLNVFAVDITEISEGFGSSPWPTQLEKSEYSSPELDPDQPRNDAVHRFKRCELIFRDDAMFGTVRLGQHWWGVRATQ
jgi:hypothetical protein